MVTVNSKAWSIISTMSDNAVDDIHEALVKIATEQDRIARQEERERCINAAIHWNCDFCMETSSNWNAAECTRCATPSKIRKAIEEGGVS